MGISLSGAGSWFNHGSGEPGPGPADPGNSNQASGISFFQPGIAVYRSDTLRGWWKVTDGHGNSFVVQQTDYGPAPWTNRVVDFTYSARQAFLGGRDPTGEHFQLEYLGMNKPAGAGTTTSGAAAPAANSQAPQAQAPAASSGTGFDQAGFDKAQKAFVAGSAISKSGSSPYAGVPGLNFGSGANPLFSMGLLRTSAPNKADFMSGGSQQLPAAQAALQKLAGSGTQVQAHPDSKLQAMVAMANSLLGHPYVWGGGHGGWTTSGGFDCSGFVSAVLHAGGYLSSPQTTDTLPGQSGILSGPGQVVTIYDRVGGQGHVIIEINGQFYEAGGSSGPWGGGGGVMKIGRPSDSYLASFGTVLHPQGL